MVKCLECRITLTEYEFVEYRKFCIDCKKEKEKEKKDR
jgi:hypothetical protein